MHLFRSLALKNEVFDGHFEDNYDENGKENEENERLGNKICPISCIEDFFCVYLQTNE
jgi:hypothetical protein